ncbi:MAG TPA: deoxynucleoside kinase [Bacteroidales bacterium]|nr:deoxynucleoside kinase [Bacteroidales bacterium]HRZ48920.1 deoxynucleoside kinase [Bacteroidales bacterium]
MIPSVLYHYICIEGNIGAGKTTLASLLAEATGSRLILEEFDENPFLPLFYKDPARYALQTELTFLADRYRQLSENLVQRSLFEPVTIADYHLYKSRLFARNNLNDIDFRLYDRIFQIVEGALPRPDILLYLQAEPEQLLENIARRGRPYEQTITKEYLASLGEKYLAYLTREFRFPVIAIPMNNYDEGQKHPLMLLVSELLQKSFEPGFHIL